MINSQKNDSLKVLAIQGNNSCLQLLVRLLEINGFEVTPALGGKEALDLSEKPYDAIFTDIVLGDGTNGLRIIDKLKAGSPTAKTVAISTFDQPEFRQLVLEKYDYLITKPLIKEQMEQICATIKGDL